VKLHARAELVTISYQEGEVVICAADGRAAEEIRQQIEASAYVPMQFSTVEEFAKRMRFSTRTVSEWIKKGLPIYRIGSDIRIADKEADEWLRDHFRLSRKKP
jgi:excisionase family DNA binding protein